MPLAAGMFPARIWNSTTTSCADFFTLTFLNDKSSCNFLSYFFLLKHSDSTTHTLLDTNDGTACVVHLPLNSQHQVGRLQYMVDQNRSGLKNITFTSNLVHLSLRLRSTRLQNILLLTWTDTDIKLQSSKWKRHKNSCSLVI